MIIGLISCVKMKRSEQCKAKEMYISPWFKKGYEFLSYKCDKIFIMSARYGLLSPETFIYPYNETLLKMNIKQRKKWSYEIINELKKKTDFQNDKYIIVGGAKYTEFICKIIPHYEIPFNNIPTPPPHGNIVQMHWLNVWNKELKNNI